MTIQFSLKSATITPPGGSGSAGAGISSVNVFEGAQIWSKGTITLKGGTTTEFEIDSDGNHYERSSSNISRIEHSANFPVTVPSGHMITLTCTSGTISFYDYRDPNPPLSAPNANIKIPMPAHANPGSFAVSSLSTQQSAVFIWNNEDQLWHLVSSGQRLGWERSVMESRTRTLRLSEMPTAGGSSYDFAYMPYISFGDTLRKYTCLIGSAPDKIYGLSSFASDGDFLKYNGYQWYGYQ